MKTISILCCGYMLAATVNAEPETLTQERALELARLNSPAISAAQLHIHAAEKNVDTAGRWLNPILDFEAENIGGDLDGVEDTQYTMALKQTVLRGDKRKYDRAVAEKSIEVARQGAVQMEVELLAAVRAAFIDVFSQQEIGKVRAQQEQLGRAFVEVAKRRYETGGASELDVVEAELALEGIILEQACCFGDLKAARIQLASLIGLSETQMGQLAGDFYDLRNIAGSSVVESHPALRRMDALIDAKRAEAARAGAQDKTDITLGAGYRYNAASEQSTFVAGASIPLNFVRAGRARQATSLFEADALQARRAEEARRLRSQFEALKAVYEGAGREAEIVRENLLPKAERAYALSRAGYDAGRFSWVELINTQQHLAEIRVRYIQALADAHRAYAEVSQFLQEGIQP